MSKQGSSASMPVPKAMILSLLEKHSSPRTVFARTRYDRTAGMGHNAVRLVAMINTHATYKPRFKFFETIIDTVNRELPAAFTKVLKRRVGTHH